MAHPFAKNSEMASGKEKAKALTKGYKTGGSIGKAVTSNPAKYASGGSTSGSADMKTVGKASGGRLDKFARGGRSKGKKGGNKTNINIVVAPHGKHPAVGAAPPAPGDLPPPGGGPMPPPPGGPMGGPPLGGPPGGIPGGPPGMPPGMPPKPPGMMARGGGIKMKAGAESGEGRLEKARKYK